MNLYDLIYQSFHSTELSLVESQRKPSFNGELNGVLGGDLIGAGGLAAMMEPTDHNSDKLNGQDTQTMYVLLSLTLYYVQLIL